MSRSHKSKKKTEPKARNTVAIAAHFMSGAGNHGDKRKKKSREACRGNWNGSTV